MAPFRGPGGGWERWVELVELLELPPLLPPPPPFVFVAPERGEDEQVQETRASEDVGRTVFVRATIWATGMAVFRWLVMVAAGASKRQVSPSLFFSVHRNDNAVQILC